MEVTLKRIGTARFEAVNSRGQTAVIDGPPSIGGEDQGVRPMELVLMGLAGCSAVDVLHILQRGKQEVDRLDVRVTAERADAIPAVFTEIQLHFVVSGQVTEAKLERAVKLSLEKYCSAAKMLESTATITATCELIESTT